MAMSFFHFTLEIGISSREDLLFRFRERLRLVSLALSIPVLGLEKSALGLDLGFFLDHWPRLRTLCPRLHLCPRQIINYTVSEKSATCGVKNESEKLNITIIV